MQFLRRIAQASPILATAVIFGTLLSWNNGLYAVELVPAGEIAFTGHKYLRAGVFSQNSGVVFKSAEDGGLTTRRWSYVCNDYTCQPKAANSKALFVLEGDYTEETNSFRRYWNSSAVSAHSLQDGKTLWQFPVEGDRNFELLDLTTFAGQDVVSVINTRKALILNADKGERLAELAAPAEVSEESFIRIVTRSVYGLTSIKVIAPKPDLHIWGLPRGLIVGMSGDKTLWTLDMKHEDQDSLETFVSDMTLINPNQVLINFLEFNRHHPAVRTLIVDIHTGTIAAQYPVAEKVSFDDDHWYFRTAKGVEAYDRKTLQLVWSKEGLPSGEESELVSDSLYIYTLNRSNRRREACGGVPNDLLLLDKKDGKILATYPLLSEVRSLHLLHEGRGVIVEQNARSAPQGELGCDAINRSIAVSVKQ